MPVQAVYQFPPGFLWGCATASHQVEGQNANDWWRWEQTPGHVFQDEKVGRACDWWAGRYVEDFDRAAALHNNAQRISVEWSRIEPAPGQWDEWALKRYHEMLEALRARDMAPMITLHHFTNPLWLADQNGWLWDEAPARFEQFVRKVVGALGDVCSLWCTINEPMVYATNGYLFGTWPPGVKNRAAAGRVAVNMLRGHAAAYRAIKELQPNSQVGFAKHYLGIRPSAPALINRFAARTVDYFFNQAFLRAFVDGVARLPGSRAVSVPEVKGALDWVGLQYYQEFRAGFNLFAPRSLFITQRQPRDMPVGPHSWGGLNPGAIREHIQTLWALLQKPIYITESGVPDPDDAIRPGYLAETVHAIWKAVSFNMPVRGFFFWSLLDNFEWAEGYDPRYSFGLYRTDFQTQERFARDSAHLYSQICSENGLSAGAVERYAPALFSKLFPGEPGQNNVKLKPGKAVGG